LQKIADHITSKIYKLEEKAKVEQERRGLAEAQGIALGTQGQDLHQRLMLEQQKAWSGVRWQKEYERLEYEVKVLNDQLMNKGP